MLKGRYIFLILIMFLLSISIASAEEMDDSPIIKDNLETSSFNELQTEINSIEEGSVLNLSNDYEADSSGGMMINKSININGNNHVIDGLNQSGIFKISNSNVVLENINFINGLSDNARFAIDLNNSNVEIINCTFSYNSGAMSLINSNLSISKSVFSFNSPQGLYTSGGAIYGEDSFINVEDSIFFNNSASEGGAIYAFNSPLNVKNSDFYNNNVTFYGGAIFSDSKLTISNSRLYNNKAGYKGGAVHTTYSYKTENCSLYVDNCDLFDNSAYYGGAVSSSNIKYVIINNSRIHGNKASLGAVVLRLSRNTIEIINSSCFNNAATNGSVVYSLANGNIHFIDSHFENNTAEVGALAYSLIGRFEKNLDSYNLTVANSTLRDNIASKGLIYSLLGNVIVRDSSIIYKNKSYDVPVIYKMVGGNVTQENNWWGVENPDLDKLIVFDFNEEPNSTLNHCNESDDCASNIVQIDDENFVYSFRRDATVQICIEPIQQDEGVLQMKSDSTYFVHAFLSNNGWAFGSAGYDAPYSCEKIEAFAKLMSRNNRIIYEFFPIIYDLKIKETLGHFLVKAPNGTYAFITHYFDLDSYEEGVLHPGEWMITPNSYEYFKKGNVSDLNVSDYISASRYIAASDIYGRTKTNEFTYNFVTDEYGGKYIDAYISNDDGSFSNKTDCSIYFNDIFINDKYVFGEDVPITMDGMYLGRMTIKEPDLKINASDVIKYYKGPERFVVTLTDYENNPLANKSVIIDINGVSYTRTTDANGSASIALGLNSGTYNVTVNVSNYTSHYMATILTTVNATDITKMQRNDTQYYATFKDSNGNYLAEGTKVKFNINGVFYEREVKAEGLAKLNINLEQGTYIITATNIVTCENTANNITVLPRIVENKNITKYYKNATQYTVKILGDDGNPVGAGETVTFNINGVFYERQTNESGIAKLNINLQPEDYIITAEYKNCRVSNSITVLQVLNATDITMKYRDGTQFKANLVDKKGNPYAGQIVTFNINGEFYNRITDSSGQAKLNINLMPGQYIITSSYNGTNIANKITVTG